jgi:hypothetical protein
LAVIDEFQQDEDVMFLPLSHHQTVMLFDNYCSKMTRMIQTNELQMIGAACAVLALNSNDDVEEISMSYFQTASFCTDGSCAAEQIKEVSFKIADALHLRIAPLPETACEQIDVLLTAMQKNYPSSSTYCLSHYLGELALQAETSLKFCPCVLGSAAYALACHTLGWSEGIWMSIIRNKSDGITSLRQLQPCMSELQGLLRQALGMLTRRGRSGNLPHVIAKYSRRDRQHVAKVIITPTPWPSTCPHGHERCSGDFHCQQCEDDEREALRGRRYARLGGFATDGAFQSSHLMAGVIEDDGGHIEAELSAIFDAEASRDDVQTPVNAPHRFEGDGDLLFQRSHAKHGAADSHAGAAHSLQDVSFGAISDGNDSSFVVCPESIFDEDYLLAGPVDRRTSMTSVLGAVDEEEDVFYLGRSGPIECEDDESQTELDISIVQAVQDRELSGAWEANLERTMMDADEMRRVPDMAGLTLR